MKRYKNINHDYFLSKYYMGKRTSTTYVIIAYLWYLTMDYFKSYV